jgi:hypothetical protein
MPNIQEGIPSEHEAAAEAARAWFSRDQGSEFKLTGIVDPESVDSSSARRALQLILCGTRDGQDVCLRERFEVASTGGGFDVAHVEDETPNIGSPAPLLDPPAGVRESWLSETLAKHAFVVLVFYRGFW